MKATNWTSTVRVFALAMALMLGITGIFGTPALGPTTAFAQEAETPATDDDDGFDDWGLLGLLGLAGLLGLRRRPEHHVVTTDTTRGVR